MTAVSHRTPHRLPFLLFLAAAFATLCLAQPTLAAPKKGKRFGLEGRIVKFESEQDQLVVKVSKTKARGGNAGAPAPKSIKRGEELTFAVVPEGSVLRRTVVKSIKGGGLNKGSRESFVQALGAIPEDRDVIFSFEKNSKGAPEWTLRMIQIRMTEEELEARLNEISVEE